MILVTQTVTNVTMNIRELVDAAAVEARNQRALAEKLGVHPNMVTHWKSGKHKPDATQIAALAECANLPILETVAEIEADLDERNGEVWRRALRALQGAGVAATITRMLVAGESGSGVNETQTCAPNAHMFSN